MNDSTLTRCARRLRRSQTDVERLLWSRLRSRQIRGVKFRRQHPVAGYIVDFCCPELCLVIELDGGQHMEQQAADAKRTRALEQQGYRVLRFWNNEVIENPEGVLQRIVECIDYPHPGPLPGRERELFHG
jgi:very-short-patch-repair endonuclease